MIRTLLITTLMLCCATSSHLYAQKKKEKKLPLYAMPDRLDTSTVVKFKPKNVIGYSDSIWNVYGGLGQYFYWNHIGECHVITEHEYQRKEKIGIQQICFIPDSVILESLPGLRISMLKLNPNNEILRSLNPGKKRIVTHDPYDDRIQRSRNEQMYYEKYGGYEIDPKFWSNIRYVDSSQIEALGNTLKFDSIMPSAYAVYDVEIDTIIFSFYHIYFKQPVKVVYEPPCMFRDVIDFEEKTPDYKGGYGQYVYYDIVGYSRVITEGEYQRMQLVGVRNLKEVRKEMLESNIE